MTEDEKKGLRSGIIFIPEKMIAPEELDEAIKTRYLQELLDQMASSEDE